ncbi:GNAT family N-acetyltransferase [Pseudomonas viridiflava]|uniref:GNAT family N-acetyltransferase n=2 Tax=Pseudomonas TaxID=286 RepID=UPI000F02137A|nr:GNAT family N-acetyltransferase [Pseudomonas viridiflava]
MEHDFIVGRHKAPVQDNAVVEGVLAIVADNVTSLLMIHPPANHPKIEGYRAGLIIEIGSYLKMEPPHRMELITVLSKGVVIGFTLCGLPIDPTSKASECGIYYTCVSKSFRGKGVMNLMMMDIKPRYDHLHLSCDVALVPLYERYGFRCNAMRKHQIVMFLGNPVEDTPVQKAEDVMSHPGVMAVRRSFEAKFSEYELDRADRSLAARLQAEEDKAKRFLKLRLKTQKPQIGLIPRL